MAKNPIDKSPKLIKTLRNGQLLRANVTVIFIDTGEHLGDGNIHQKAKGHRLIV